MPLSDKISWIFNQMIVIKMDDGMALRWFGEVKVMVSMLYGLSDQTNEFWYGHDSKKGICLCSVCCKILSNCSLFIPPPTTCWVPTQSAQCQLSVNKRRLVSNRLSIPSDKIQLFKFLFVFSKWQNSAFQVSIQYKWLFGRSYDQSSQQALCGRKALG